MGSPLTGRRRPSSLDTSSDIVRFGVGKDGFGPMSLVEDVDEDFAGKTVDGKAANQTVRSRLGELHESSSS